MFKCVDGIDSSVVVPGQQFNTSVGVSVRNPYIVAMEDADLAKDALVSAIQIFPRHETAYLFVGDGHIYICRL